MPRHDESQIQPQRRAQNESLSGQFQALLLGESDPVWQFALLAEHLRGELVGVAEACGVGSMAEDVAAEVIAGWCRRVAGDPPVTFATADAFGRLRAGLLVSVRNAAMNWHRENSRTIAVDDAALAELVRARSARRCEARFGRRAESGRGRDGRSRSSCLVRPAARRVRAR